MGTKFFIVAAVVVSFFAGLVIGLDRGRETPLANAARSTEAPASGPTSRGSRMRSFFASELNLTPQQQEQMKEIWSDASRGGRDHDDKRRDLRRERDEAIVGLIRDEDRSKYEQVLKDYAERNEALDRELRENFQQAVGRTKEILSPEQREKYEKILERQQRGRGGRGRDGDSKDHGQQEHEQESSSTRPAADGATARPGTSDR